MIIMLKDFFTSNLWFNIISFVVAIIGVVCTIVFSLKATKKKSPRYKTRTVTLLRADADNIDKLTVTFDGTVLNNFYTTKIAFWNNGRDTIQGDDISCVDPLRIIVNERSALLSCELIKQTHKSDDFSLKMSEDKKSVSLLFDYIDKGHGAVIKIRHTGDRDVKVEGSIKTVNSIKKVESSVTKRWLKRVSYRKFMRMYSKVVAVITIILTGVYSVIFFVHPQLLDKPFGNTTLCGIIFAILFILLSCIYCFLYVSPKVPNKLGAVFYGEDF